MAPKKKKGSRRLRKIASRQTLKMLCAATHRSDSETQCKESDDNRHAEGSVSPNDRGHCIEQGVHRGILPIPVVSNHFTRLMRRPIREPTRQAAPRKKAMTPRAAP